MGREAYPESGKLAQEIADKYWRNGVSELHLHAFLDNFCCWFRLLLRSVAKPKVRQRRQVLATFALTHSGSICLNESYQKTGKNHHQANIELGLWTKECWTDLKHCITSFPANMAGYAVVLSTANSTKMIFKDSQGADLGDRGYWCVRDGSVLAMKFFTIFWGESYLTANFITASTE